MDPEEALRPQIDRYRAMSSEQRLRLALQLHEFACQVPREGIRHQFPQASPKEGEEHLLRRLRLLNQLRRLPPEGQPSGEP